MSQSRFLNELFLEKLVNCPSPSGSETIAQQSFREYISSFSTNVKTDILGNVMGSINPEGAPKIMLMAHVDEVGLQIRYIDEHGFLFVSALGGVDKHLVPGTRVFILSQNGPIFGIVSKIGMKHQTFDQKKQVIPIEEIFVDIGVSTKDKVLELGIQIGDPIVFEGKYRRIGDEGKVVARSFDDKVGVFIVAEVMKQLASIFERSKQESKKFHPHIIGVSSVQEEIGGRGSITATYEITPKIGIIFDVTSTTDIPQVKPDILGKADLGGGPIIYRGPNINPTLSEIFIQTARDLDIPIQIRAVPGVSPTDARHVQISREGVATQLVSIPNRYMHSTCELVHLDDIEAIIQLTTAVIVQIRPEMSFIPY